MKKIELHCHSIDASPCSTESAESIVDIYVKAGYDAILLTNHYARCVYEIYGCKSIDEYVDIFMRAVEKVKKAAEGKIQVLVGAELRFDGSVNDYLWFGFDEEFLRKTPDLFEMGIVKFHEICQEKGWLVVQAHPFRNGMMVINPAYLDGVEVYNGHVGHDSRNFIARNWAEEYGLIKTSGTDLHYAHVPATGGILTDEKVENVNDLIGVLKSGKYTLLTTDLVK